MNLLNCAAEEKLKVYKL